MERLKDAGAAIIGLGIVVGIGLLIFALIEGAGNVVAWAMPAIATINGVVFWISVLVLLPMALIRKTRKHGAVGLIYASFMFGFTTWCIGLLTTLSLWGVIAVVIGILLGGIGVVPIGMLAAIFNGEWGLLGSICLGLALAFGSRFLGLHLAQKAEEESLISPDMA